MNRKEIIIAGMKRSGNHALINFVLGHLGKSYVVNWRNSREIGVHRNRVKMKLLEKNGLSTEFMPFPELGFRIVSLENVHDLSVVERISNRTAVVKRMVILRDPQNWLASTIKAMKQRWRERIFKQIEGWKKNAKYVLSDSRKCFFVDFGRFVEQDPLYRRTVSEYIEEDFSDIGIQYISSVGSSFDKRRRYQGRALDMDLKNRWLDPSVKDLVAHCMDAELEEYSRTIFGDRV